MTDVAAGQVRRFNRLVAERIGLLTDRFLGRGRPMAEARILWEIGPGGVGIRELVARLGLDPAYLSRVLRSLVAARLVRVRPAVEDRRTRIVELTAAGRREQRVLERRSAELAESLLAPLSARQRKRLVDSMSVVERLLTAALVDVVASDPADPDARYCQLEYLKELDQRFELGFDPGQSISAEPREFRPPAGLFLVARLRGDPIGCGGLKLHGNEPAEIKRMWVAPTARGLGVGARILAELESRANAAGVSVVRLETNRALEEAIAMYRSRGYREVAPFSGESYADHWFEKRLG